jgi:hypothetical protein
MTTARKPSKPPGCRTSYDFDVLIVDREDSSPVAPRDRVHDFPRKLTLSSDIVYSDRPVLSRVLA